MAYEEDRDMDLDETANFEDDPVYGADTYFGERLDKADDDMSETSVEEEVAATDTIMPDGSEEVDAMVVEEDEPAGFGETLSNQKDETHAEKPNDED